MPVFKYRDPNSGEWINVAGGGGGAGESVDAYTKEETLSEETKMVLGLGVDAVPNDVFGVLSRFQNSLGNEYVWAKMGTVWHAERQKSGTFVRFSGDSYYIGTEIEVSNSGVISIKNPTTTTNGSDTVNKYFAKVSSPNTVMYGTSGTQNIYWDTYYDNVVAVGSEGVESYFNSPNANAYGDGYDYLGRLGDAFGGAKVATGNYTGTGAYGASKPNSLTFDFEPKLVFIQCANPNSDYALVTLCLCNPVTEAVTLFNSFGSNGAGNSYYGTRVVVSWSGKSCSFYTTAATSTNKHTLGQMNATNIKYNYIAIG